MALMRLNNDPLVTSAQLTYHRKLFRRRDACAVGDDAVEQFAEIFTHHEQ